MDLAVTLTTHQIGGESHITTTSLQVAQHFGKRHNDVLRAIRNMECSDQFRLRNFAQSSYLNEQGKTQPFYLMTHNGFGFVVMGFTGKEAARWKETYLDTFTRMQEALRAHYIEPLIEDKQFRQGIPLKLKLMMQDQGLRLRKQLGAEPDHDNRVALYWSLFQVNSSLGIPTESMAVLVGDALPAPTLISASKPNR